MCHNTIYSLLYLFCQIKGIIVPRAMFGLNPHFVLRTPCAFVFASRCQSGTIALAHFHSRYSEEFGFGRMNSPSPVISDTSFFFSNGFAVATRRDCSWPGLHTCFLGEFLVDHLVHTGLGSCHSQRSCSVRGHKNTAYLSHFYRQDPA